MSSRASKRHVHWSSESSQTNSAIYLRKRPSNLADRQEYGHLELQSSIGTKHCKTEIVKISS